MTKSQQKKIAKQMIQQKIAKARIDCTDKNGVLDFAAFGAIVAFIGVEVLCEMPREKTC